MKLKHILLILLCLSIGNAAEAQLLKKLKQKAQEAAERSLLNKTDEVVSDKTDQALDSLITPDSNNPEDMLGEPIPAPPDNNVKVPDSYNFSYKVTMEIKKGERTKEMEYYLQPDEAYYVKKEVKDKYTQHVVYDIDIGREIYFVEMEGEKIISRKKMDLLTVAKLVGAYRDAPNREVKPIGSKNILGYNCEGYEITTDSGTTQVWITNEAPATMYRTLFEKRAEAPDSPFTKNTMIMETTFTSKEDRGRDYQMVCTQFQPENLVFNKDDYIEF
ncbi:MAG: DUF4412 domain-containing protein [Draconibacterium sp.]